MFGLRTSTAKQSKSLWKLGGLTLRQLCRGVLKEIVANEFIGHAAELAYYWLFALFPLVLIMMTLFGMFASHSGTLQANLLSYFEGVLPSEAFQLMRRVTGELAAYASGGKLTFAVISALWFISEAIHAMISSLNRAYHVRDSRSWFKVRAIALGLSALIAILVLLTMVMGLVGGRFVDRIGSELGLRPIFVLAWRALRWPVVILFVAMSCSLIHHCGANLKDCHHGIWRSPGSAFGVLVLLGASFAFRTYLQFSNSYSATYGSIGAAMILLVWFYMAGLTYLIGAVINAEIERAESAKM